MMAARKNADDAPWVTVPDAMRLLEIKTRYTLLNLVLKGDLESKTEEMSGRMFISRESIEQHRSRLIAGSGQPATV